jgi:molybdate transport system ATP-binding protein
MSDRNAILARFKLRRVGFTLDVDLQLPGRGITVLQGSSGSGKTTILRCMAGLERADEGFFQVNGNVWQDDECFLQTYKRPIGYVFQEDSLFDHLTAQGNLLFGCRDKRHIPADLMPLIELLGITHLLQRYPRELSGGERQRVAIVRALAVKPELLLMDEPLSSLDFQRKSDIFPYLEQIRDFNRIPIVYVTHDRNEAARLSDYLVMLEDGHLKF